jgi:hypothetical protein
MLLVILAAPHRELKITVWRSAHVASCLSACIGATPKPLNLDFGLFSCLLSQSGNACTQSHTHSLLHYTKVQPHIPNPSQNRSSTTQLHSSKQAWPYGPMGVAPPPPPPECGRAPGMPAPGCHACDLMSWQATSTICNGWFSGKPGRTCDGALSKTDTTGQSKKGERYHWLYGAK